MALHAAQAVPEIAVSRVRKSQEEVTGKRTREGEEEGGGGIQKAEIRRKKKEFRRQKAAGLVCWCLRPASMLKEAWIPPPEISPDSWCWHIPDLEPE
jgi:hypothetical protein